MKFMFINCTVNEDRIIAKWNTALG